MPNNDLPEIPGVNKYRYTIEDHKKAFQLFCERPSYTYVGKIVKAPYTTVQTWSETIFKCPWNCPWHGWNKLIKSSGSAATRSIEMALLGSDSEEDRQAIIKEEVSKVISADKYKQRQSVERHLSEVVRSDLERLSHWEYLYGKVWFDLTGIPLDYRHLRRIQDGEPYNASEVVELYGKGLRFESAEKAMYALGHIQGQIDKLRERLNPTANKPPEEATPTSVVNVEHIQELRLLRETIQNTPSTQVNFILQQLQPPTSDKVIDVKHRSIDPPGTT
jgi:hypothetical protein